MMEIKGHKNPVVFAHIQGHEDTVGFPGIQTRAKAGGSYLVKNVHLRHISSQKFFRNQRSDDKRA